MVDEILKEVATSEDTEDARSEQILLWVHGVEAQMAQKSALNEIKEAKYHDILNITGPYHTQGMQMGGQLQILWHKASLSSVMAMARNVAGAESRTTLRQYVG